MRNYEAMFIFRPDLSDEVLEKEVKQIEKTIKTKGKGKVKYDILGKKSLAYPIEKSHEGIYVNYLFSAESLTIAKIKDAFQHNDNILRFIVFVKGKGK